MAIHLHGLITAQGELKLDLPSGLPIGEARVTIEIPTQGQEVPEGMTKTLTEERRIARKVPVMSPTPADWLVIFKKIGEGRVLYKVLPPGEGFRRPLLTSAERYEAYAVSADSH